MPAAIRSLIRARRWFQSGPAAEASSLAMSGASSAGAGTERWAGGRSFSVAEAGPRRRLSVLTHCSATNSSGSGREPRRRSGESGSALCGGPVRTVLAPLRATLPHPLRTTGGPEDRPSY